MARTVHRTVYQVEVFSDDPYPDRDLAQIAYDIDQGDCIGDVQRMSTEIVPPELVEAEMLRIGNDGTFFSDFDEEE